jgi:hypothetical protein
MSMVTSSTPATRRAHLLAALVAVLFVGLVGMHHLSTASSDAPRHDAAASSTAAPSAVDHDASDQSRDRPHEGHALSLLHLCLAVLTAIAVIAAVLVAWRTGDIGERRSAKNCWSRPRTAPRAPPASAPARLALLCVLRT